MMRKTDPILMAAKDAFIENGFRNTSMDEVAARAGTTKKTVYNNFASKEVLLDAVIDHAIAMFEEAVPALDTEADTKHLTRFLSLLLEFVTWRAAIGLQRLIIAEGAAFPALAHRLTTRSSAALRQPLSEWLKTHGVPDKRARDQANAIVDGLTAKARLDRLVGLRDPYPLLPGKNRLDGLDRTAVETAVRQLEQGDSYSSHSM